MSSRFDAKKRKKYIKKNVVPFKVKNNSNVSDVLKRMGDTAFQGKTLSIGTDIWEKMIHTDCTIFFGLAGAMVPAGMREIIVYLIKNRYIDVLVSTGANLFHDIHETLGMFHYKGSHMVDDSELREAGVDRMYDVFAVDEEFNTTDEFIYKHSLKMDNEKLYTTREYFEELGKELNKHKKTEGIVSSAQKAGVPIYCPAFGDSSIGIALAMAQGNSHLKFDVIGDVKETAHLAATAKSSGIVFIGGGTPKNYIQQTEVTADMMGKRVAGHKYAVQFSTDAPHWGGLSGCTFDESESWGKIAKTASRINSSVDSTIALPLVVTALSERLKKHKRKLPEFDFKNAYKVKKPIWDK